MAELDVVQFTADFTAALKADPLFAKEPDTVKYLSGTCEYALGHSGDIGDKLTEFSHLCQQLFPSRSYDKRVFSQFELSYEQQVKLNTIPQAKYMRSLGIFYDVLAATVRRDKLYFSAEEKASFGHSMVRAFKL